MTRAEAMAEIEELLRWDSAADPVLPDNAHEALRFALRALRMDETMAALEKEANT